MHAEITVRAIDVACWDALTPRSGSCLAKPRANGKRRTEKRTYGACFVAHAARTIRVLVIAVSPPLLVLFDEACFIMPFASTRRRNFRHPFLSSCPNCEMLRVRAAIQRCDTTTQQREHTTPSNKDWVKLDGNGTNDTCSDHRVPLPPCRRYRAFRKRQVQCMRQRTSSPINPIDLSNACMSAICKEYEINS